MGQIDIKFVSDKDFNDLVKQSEIILQNSKEIAKQFEGVSKKGMSADMAKMVEMEKKLVLLAEKLRQEQEKTRILHTIANDQATKKLITEERLTRQTQKTRLEQERLTQQMQKTKLEQERLTQQATKKLITEERLTQQMQKTRLEQEKTEYQLKKIAHQQEQLNNKIKTGGKDMRGWGDALNSFQFKFNFLGNAITNVVSSLISGIKDFAVSSVKAFMEAENGDKRLLVSLQKNQIAFDRLNAKAGEFQKRSIYDDDSIKAGMTFLAMQGRNEAQINKVIEGAMALSRVTGDDLDTSIKKLDQTFEGSIGKLGKLDSGFKTLTKEQLANGEAIDLVTKKYGSLIDAVSTEDKIKQMENAWGDLKEQFGSFAAGIMNNVLPALTTYFEELTGFIDGTKKAINAVFDEQVQFSAQQKADEVELAKLYAMTAKEREDYFRKYLIKSQESAISFSESIQRKEEALEKIRRLNFQLEVKRLEARNRARQKEIDNTNKSIKENTDALNDSNEITREKIELTKISTGYYEREESASQKAKKEAFELNYQLARGFGLTHIEAKKVAEEIDKVGSSIENLDIKASKLSESGGGLPKTHKAIKNVSDAYTTFLMEVKKGSSINDALIEALGGGENGAQRLATLKDGFNTALNAYQSFLSAKADASRQDVENSTNRIQELQNNLQAEIQLNQQGYASNIQGRLQQIEAEEQIRNNAIKQQEKYQKQQAIIDSAMMVASTAVSVANIFKVWSGVPFVGPILAGVQIGAMLLQIAAAQTKAKSLAKFGKGGRVGGRKHSEGGTIIEAERDEFVMNADSANQYYDTLEKMNQKESPDVILNSFRKDVSRKGGSDRDILTKILNKFPDKNKKEITIVNGKIIERWADTTRIYN